MGAVVSAARRNGAIAVLLVGVVAAMAGLAYAAVPLYDLFCRVTGYGGTTQVATANAEAVSDRRITVRFNADVARGMPWRFQPVQREISLRLGETGLALYRAVNETDQRIVGTATYNVTPQKAGLYFAKLDCFCFTEQVLEPGQTADMAVQFFVDPEITDDPNLDDVTTITLSYTLFRTDDAAGAIAQGPTTTGEQ